MINEMPPREEQMTQTKNATKQKRNNGAERQSQGGDNRVQVNWIKPNFKPHFSNCYTLKLLFQSAPQKQTQSWRGTMLAADFSEFKKCRGAAPNQPCVSPVRHVGFGSSGTHSLNEGSSVP